ncbi:DEAD/DEAH box helicase family protein [Sinorhizobium fredii]|uniref:Helicase/UvrB domain-containing protein n=1 Tax=Rhizobium fredii TaxID=380 RepID=A0A2L0H8K7_RHIFR|nr:DEAD/DEAH box helicase family protein [Sinorhizobium fredii]AUX77820.1 helicase/UvrB domain-containing protein [Sinorhizobium fredii]
MRYTKYSVSTLKLQDDLLFFSLSKARPTSFDHLLNITWEEIDVDPTEFEGFNQRVERALRKRFAERDHFPSEENWDGLRAIIQTIKAMAAETAQTSYFVSPLPTGMGKTTAIAVAVGELIRLGEKTGIMILVDRLEQIDALIAEIGLKPHQYAVRTADKNKDLNSKGVGEDTGDDNYRNDRAQVLFTTQQRLYALASKGLGLKNMRQFDYRGKPRQVKIWDEAILPALPRTVSADDIKHLLRPLRTHGFISQRDALNALATRMEESVGNCIPTMPDIDFSAVKPFLSADQVVIVEGLERMAEGKALIRHDPFDHTVALYYDELLPPDFAPLLILDASGRLRKSYELWSHGRGNLEFLSGGRKAYHNLTIRHWNRGAGKITQRRLKDRLEIAQGVAEVAATTTEPEVLIIHQPTQTNAPATDMEHVIGETVKRRMEVEGRVPPKLHFLAWGWHTGINKFRDVKHVIVVGLNQYSKPQQEAAFRAAHGKSLATVYSDADIDAFHAGEVAHHLFQAVGRGALRKVHGDDCPKGCQLDVIFAECKPIDRDLLRATFPDAKIDPWWPLGETLIPTEQRLVDELERIAPDRVGGLPGWVKQRQLAEAVGIDARNIIEALNRPRVVQELARRGIKLVRKRGDRRGIAAIRFAEPLRGDDPLIAVDDPILRRVRRNRRRNHGG